METQEMPHIVIFKDGKPKGLFTSEKFLPKSKWWDEEKTISIPKNDWETEKVHIGNIRFYFKIYPLI